METNIVNQTTRAKRNFIEKPERTKSFAMATSFSMDFILALQRSNVCLALLSSEISHEPKESCSFISTECKLENPELH